MICVQFIFAHLIHGNIVHQISDISTFYTFKCPKQKKKVRKKEEEKKKLAGHITNTCVGECP